MFRILRPIAWSAVALLVILALLLVVPGARARMVDLVRQVGQVSLIETGDYPGDGEPVDIIATRDMDLQTAQTTLPLEINLPAWVPEEYILEDRVYVTQFSEGYTDVYLNWVKPGERKLTLHISSVTNDQPMSMIIGANSAEEVQVNGQPAALVRGGWSADSKQWEENGSLSIYWRLDGETYFLMAGEDDLTVEELIRIAESIP